MARPNTYPASPGNYRNFWTADGLVICRRCNQVGHFRRACQGNPPPPRAPKHYQNHDATMSLPAPPNIHGRHALPIAPTINILRALPIDHTSINAILWDILTHKMPPLPVPHDDHHSHPLIKPTTSTKLEGLTFQVNTTIIAIWFKIIPYKTNSASTHPSMLITSSIHTPHPSTRPTHTTHPHASLSTLTHPIIKLILNQSPYQPK